MARSVARSLAAPSIQRSSAPPSGRRRAWLQATCGLWLATLSPTGRTSESARTLLVMGDSLSAEYGLPRGSGWVMHLQRRIEARQLGWKVVNASISGETSAGGRARIDELLRRHLPALVVIELGGNDALRGLPLGTTENHLRDMIRATQRSGARVVLFGMQMPPNYGRAYSEQFSAMFAKLAQSERTALLPFFLQPIADRTDAFQADRIHPTEAVQAELMEHAWTVLGPLLADGSVPAGRVRKG